MIDDHRDCASLSLVILLFRYDLDDCPLIWTRWAGRSAIVSVVPFKPIVSLLVFPFLFLFVFVARRWTTCGLVWLVEDVVDKERHGYRSKTSSNYSRRGSLSEDGLP